MSRNRQTLASDHPGDLLDARRPIVSVSHEAVQGHQFHWHRHRRAQLVLASRGVVTVKTDDGTWVVPPQQAVWVPAGVEHAVEWPGLLTLRSLYVDPSACDRMPPSCCVFTVPALLRELVLRASSLGNDYALDGAEARLMAVIPDELRRLTPEPLHLPLPQDPRLCAVTDALMADPGNDRALGDWARAAGASERTLARLFRRQTGLTFGLWRQRLRLLAAVSRLAEGQPVTTVAYDLGYGSPSAFISMFRRTLGQTPGRYLSPPN